MDLSVSSKKYSTASKKKQFNSTSFWGSFKLIFKSFGLEEHYVAGDVPFRGNLKGTAPSNSTDTFRKL